jgi:hypothetical protein
MWPREHGAYGQLLFPLGTALAISGLTPSALLVTIAAVAAFIAHEPLLVLTGGRGARLQREHHRRATRWLGATTGLAIAAGSAAVASAPAETRLMFLWPLLLATALLVFLVYKREKTAAGETVAALALSSVAIPICASSTAAATSGFIVAVLFAGLFMGGTLAVRVVILTVRGGGDPPGVRRTRVQLATVVVIMTTAVVWAPTFDLKVATAAFAVLPGFILAIALAAHPPAATQLRTVGWTLIGTSAWAAAVLVGALR